MQLSEEARKRALAAYKAELSVDFTAFKAALDGRVNWDSSIKSKLHKLKGGASFLGFEDISNSLASLERQSLSRPLDVMAWSSELSRLEQLLENLF